MTPTEQILNFEPEFWVPDNKPRGMVYYHKDDWARTLTPEQYEARFELREELQFSWNLIHRFRRDCLPFGQIGEFEIRNFLDKEFKERAEKTFN